MAPVLCLLSVWLENKVLKQLWKNSDIWLSQTPARTSICDIKTYFNKKGQSVLFEGKEAEHMMLATLGKRHQVSKAVSIYRFSFQHLCVDIGDI